MPKINEAVPGVRPELPGRMITVRPITFKNLGTKFYLRHHNACSGLGVVGRKGWNGSFRQTKPQTREQFMKKILLSALMASAMVSAQAAVYEYSFTFGPEAVGATGSGTGTAFYNDLTHSFQMTANFSGLSGNVTQTHFHGATATPGVGTASIMVGNTSLPGFPLGATSGSYSQTIDLSLGSVYNGAYLNTTHGGNVAAAEAGFINGMNQGRVYWNIHSSTFGGGEIRAWATLVPEPSAAALAIIGFAGLVLRRLKGKNQS